MYFLFAYFHALQTFDAFLKSIVRDQNKTIFVYIIVNQHIMGFDLDPRRKVEAAARWQVVEFLGCIRVPTLLIT